LSLNHTRAEVTRAESDIADLGKKLSAETAKEADLIRKQADINSGVVQIRVTPKTRNPFTIKALSISGVTWKWHFLNHAPISLFLRPDSLPEWLRTRDNP